MRRLHRQEHKQGLVEERRRLVGRYVTIHDEPAPAPSEPVDVPAPEPESASEQTHDRSRPPGPATFDGAFPAFAEVVRLCEEVARLGEECDRQRKTLAGAAARLLPETAHRPDSRGGQSPPFGGRRSPSGRSR
jgi:hypothetical protein